MRPSARLITELVPRKLSLPPRIPTNWKTRAPPVLGVLGLRGVFASVGVRLGEVGEGERCLPKGKAESIAMEDKRPFQNKSLPNPWQSSPFEADSAASGSLVLVSIGHW